MIGTENLKLAKELGIEQADLLVLTRVVEILNIRPPFTALERQDEAELAIAYLKAKYRKLAAIAERDYHAHRGVLRRAEMMEWTSPRGRVDEGLSDIVESFDDLHDLRTRREAYEALKDLLWGMRDTVYARRRTLEERNITERKEH